MNGLFRGESIFSAAMNKLRGKPATKIPARTPAPKPRRHTPPPSNPYRAASVACAEGACPAAREIAKQRFLVQDVPTIPLPDCTSKTCKCRYTRFPDRRRLEERRANVSPGLDTGASPLTKERRGRRGRRANESHRPVTPTPASALELQPKSSNEKNTQEFLAPYQ